MKKVIFTIIGVLFFLTGCSFNEMINSNDPNYLTKQLEKQIKSSSNNKKQIKTQTYTKKKTYKIKLVTKSNFYNYSISFGYIYPIYLINNTENNLFILKNSLNKIKNKFTKINKFTKTTYHHPSGEDIFMCKVRANTVKKMGGTNYQQVYDECISDYTYTDIVYSKCKYEDLYVKNNKKQLFVTGIESFYRKNKNNISNNQIYLIVKKIDDKNLFLYILSKYELDYCGNKIINSIIFDKNINKIKIDTQTFSTDLNIDKFNIK